MIKNSLGDRMKQYEAVPKNFLMRKSPAILQSMKSLQCQF